MSSSSYRIGLKYAALNFLYTGVSRPSIGLQLHNFISDIEEIPDENVKEAEVPYYKRQYSQNTRRKW